MYKYIYAYNMKIYAKNMQEISTKYAKKNMQEICRNMQVYAGQLVPLKYAKICKLYAMHMQKHAKYAITICTCKLDSDMQKYY